jgi:protein SCO1/2
MNRLPKTSLIFTLTLFLCQPVLAEYPENSIYQLDSTWLTQDSQSISLHELAGNKILLSMTYTSCQHTCPTIVSNMQAIENHLSEAERDEVKFVLVSLMPTTDTPEVLKAYAEKRGLDGWLLLSGNDEDVRTLAMVLDVKYVPAGEAEISHSNLITILDTQGTIEHKIQGTSVDLKSAMEYLR